MTRTRGYSLPNAAQHLQPVHVRHLDVQGDYVGVPLRDSLQPKRAVRGRPNHFQRRVLLQGMGDEAPNDDRVVYDHDTNSFAYPERSLIHGTSYTATSGIMPKRSNVAWRTSLVKGFITYSFAPASRAIAMWPNSASVVTIAIFTESSSGL